MALVAAALMSVFGIASAYAQAGRIYTKTQPEAHGGIIGKVPLELTHAMAVERDRVRVFRAELNDGDKSFRFDHLPTGKYDLVFISKSGAVFEGLALGEGLSSLSPTSAANLEKRIKVADTFFNHYKVHREGLCQLDESGDGLVLAFVERLRPDDVLKGSGERVNKMIRRFEIIELHEATDDWQMVGTRHLYREGEPIPKTPEFLKHTQVPEMGGIRVIDEVKDMGTIALPEKP